MSDWIIRTALPAWLELSGGLEPANALRGLPPIVSTKQLERALPILQDVRNAAQSSMVQIFHMNGPAGRDACRQAAGMALWASGLPKATKAMWATEMGDRYRAVMEQAWDLIKPSIRDAAWIAAWPAAFEVIGNAAGNRVWLMAFNAASAKLRPTSETLGNSRNVRVE